MVDKGPGVLVQRARPAVPALLDHLGADYGFVHPVHRLDQEVSGLLVVGRDQEAALALRAQFREHTAERRYVAGVHGVPAKDQGRLQHELAQNQGNFRMYEARPGQGRRAVTHWFVTERYPDAALLEVLLETGVKNQIRVQLALSGHPLLGEQKYRGDKAIQRDRIFLHAALLAFDAPGEGRREFSSPLPRDLLRWQERLKGGGDGELRRGSPRPSSRRRRPPRSR